VKEAGRRFKEHDELTSTATALDRDLSVKKDYITIQGNESVFKTSWMAAGNLVNWNMVHYDRAADWRCRSPSRKNFRNGYR